MVLRKRATAAGVTLAAVVGLSAGPATGAEADRPVPRRVEALSFTLAGRPGNEVRGATASTDACRVVFNTGTRILQPGAPYNSDERLYLRDRSSDRTRLVATDSAGRPGTGTYGGGLISGDGRYVALESLFASLTPPGTVSERWLLRKDLRTGRLETHRMPHATGPATGLPFSGFELRAVSADGRLSAGQVWYTSADYNTWFVRIAVFDWATHRRSLHGPYGDSRIVESMSADGRYLAYTAASFGQERELYLLDRDTGRTRHVGRGPAGKAARHYYTHLSGDGRLLFTDWNRTIGTAEMTIVVRRTSDLAVVDSVPDGSMANAVSYTGRWVLLSVGRPDDSGNIDVYRWDRHTGRRVLVSVTRDSRLPSGDSWGVAISTDGTTAVFTSHAGDIVPGDLPDDGDTDTNLDVFAATAPGAPGCG